MAPALSSADRGNAHAPPSSPHGSWHPLNLQGREPAHVGRPLRRFADAICILIAGYVVLW